MCQKLSSFGGIGYISWKFQPLSSKKESAFFLASKIQDKGVSVYGKNLSKFFDAFFFVIVYTRFV